MTSQIVTTICTTAVTIVTLVIGFLAQRAKTEKIHQAVNGTTAAHEARIEQLTAALAAAGADVPRSEPPAAVPG